MSVFVSRTAALSLSLSLAALALGAGPADAQGFLKNLAREAAYRAAAAAAAGGSQPPQPVEPQDAQQAVAADDGGAGEAEAPATPSTGPAPWPLNAGARNIKYPKDLQFAPEYEQQKKDFVEWSKVRCTACEGGYSYDAWAPHFIRTDGSWKAWEKKLGELPVGQSLTWKGSQATGTITATSDTAINGWPCKQLKWTLKRPNESTERLGLVCFTFESSYSGKETWNILL